MKFENILITGGCGFLGQYLIRDLLNEFDDSRIKVLDLKPNPNSLFDFTNNLNIKTLLNKNICDYDSIACEFKNTDLVIHLAGIVSFSVKDKELLEAVNVRGTRNVLEAAAFNRVKRFIHISSVAALGFNNNKNKTVNEDFHFDWNIAEKRKKYYMLTKHLADIEVGKYAAKGLDCVTLYPGLMFGPGDMTNSARLIKAIKQKRIPFNMPGGTNIVDVRDTARGIAACLKNWKTDTGYLLSGHNLTFKEINGTIAEELGVKCPALTLPAFLNPLLFNLLNFIESRAKNKLELTADNLDSAFKFRYFDNNKAGRELEWRPEISFKQTIKDTIEWMDRNAYFV